MSVVARKEQIHTLLHFTVKWSIFGAVPTKKPKSFRFDINSPNKKPDEGSWFWCS